MCLAPRNHVLEVKLSDYVLTQTFFTTLDFRFQCIVNAQSFVRGPCIISQRPYGKDKIGDSGGPRPLVCGGRSMVQKVYNFSCEAHCSSIGTPHSVLLNMLNQKQPSKVLPRDTFNDRLLSKNQLAQRVGVSVRTVEFWMSKKLIPYVKVRKTVRFMWTDVEEALKRGFGVGYRLGATGNSLHP